MQSKGYFVASLLMGLILCVPLTANSAEEQDVTHRTLTGVVVQKGGTLAVKAPNGTTYQTNENASRRHGHEPFKEGDEVSFILDANNIVIDMHLKGEEGEHMRLPRNREPCAVRRAADCVHGNTDHCRERDRGEDPALQL